MDESADIDGDGSVSPWETNLCRLCLILTMTMAFGKEALGLL